MTEYDELCLGCGASPHHVGCSWAPTDDHPIRPLRAFGRVHVVDGLPDDVVLMAYAPPAPGTRPGDPDWVPLERRTAMIVDRPDHGSRSDASVSEPPKS